MFLSKPEQMFSAQRERMVDQQIRRRGVADPGVLAAMARVPRHRFVDPTMRDRAYADSPLPIGQGQTISQPYMVARMTELCTLAPSHRVLEVGSGSGYQTAILAQLAGEVFATEIIGDLCQGAATVLQELGYGNVTLACRDGSQGWPENAPFDAILVAAGAPTVPRTLTEQLAEGGRLIIPAGTRETQVLHVITRSQGQLVASQDTPCRFVALRGVHGWDGHDDRQQ